jgi:pimeloyl-ACP methyl ester carboxylesterase
MRKAYLSIGKTQLHYRTRGKGQPIVLLHASPRSSEMMLPLGTLLSEHYNVIAPDLFGYGNSDPLPSPPQSIYDYVPMLKRCFTKLKLKQFALYGTATGAQLGIAYALTYPEDVTTLFLDNAAHFEEDERTAILAHYFPDFSPKLDGSHLMDLWQHILDAVVYFPWFDKTQPVAGQTADILSKIPPSVFQAVFKNYLEAGNNYDLAYRHAFVNEKAENVQKLTIPTTLFHWLQSPILPYVERLLAFDLPKNVSVARIEGGDRFGQMREVIRQNYGTVQ